MLESVPRMLCRAVINGDNERVLALVCGSPSSDAVLEDDTREGRKEFQTVNVEGAECGLCLSQAVGDNHPAVLDMVPCIDETFGGCARWTGIA